jgi:uncharacterized protein YcfJ
MANNYDSYQDISQELQEYSKRTYSNLTDDVKSGINNILGKNKESNMRKRPNVKGMLVGATIGGFVCHYKGWNMFIGIATGAIAGNYIGKKMIG